MPVQKKPDTDFASLCMQSVLNKVYSDSRQKNVKCQVRCSAYSSHMISNINKALTNNLIIIASLLEFKKLEPY